MKRALAVALALLLAGTAHARGFVVCEISTPGSYLTSNVDPARTNISELLAVNRMLAGWGCMQGADYDILRPSEAKTEFVRTGAVVHNYGSAGAYVEQYTWGIVVGFNGSGTSQFINFRPESLLVTGSGTTRGVTIPLLILLDGQSSDVNWNTSASDSTSINVGGIGAEEHHVGAIASAYGKPWVFSDIGDGCQMALFGAVPKNGGIRSLLSFNLGAASVLPNDGVNATNWFKYPDSTFARPLGTRADTAYVWQYLNSGTPLKPITMAAPFTQHLADSTGVSYRYDQLGVSWPVLGFAIAALDSQAGGAIIKSPKRFAFVANGAGSVSDRRSPQGFFAADSSIRSASGDSVRATGAKLLVAAGDSMSAAEAVSWKRFGLVRFTPYVRLGLDTLALGADGRAMASTASPVDVWGRYRNRTFYQLPQDGATAPDSSVADSSIYQLYKQARANLAATVGSNYLSNAIVAPDDDWSPYQMRRNQNAALFDSVAWVAAKLGCPVIVTNSWGRDSDPLYLTNPKGWLYTNLRYTVKAASLKGTVVNFVGHQQFTVRGSRMQDFTDYRSWGGHNNTDSTATNAGRVQTVSNYQEYAFWNSLYGPWAQIEYNAGASLWSAAAKPAWSSTSNDDMIGTHQRASIFMLPAQSFGGQSAVTPNRWGFWAIKHVMGAANLINYAAGRTVMQNVWPEEIVP